MLNEYQEALKNNYNGGEYNYITSSGDAHQYGDSLFGFMMQELDTCEGCDTREEALKRLREARQQVEEAIEAVAAAGTETEE